VKVNSLSREEDHGSNLRSKKASATGNKDIKSFGSAATNSDLDRGERQACEKRNLKKKNGERAVE